MHLVYALQDPIRWKHLDDVENGLSPTLPHLKGLENGDIATSAIKQVQNCVLVHVYFASNDKH